MSASERGFIASNGAPMPSSRATVSGLNGTEPISNVGLSRAIGATSAAQQSPTRGNRPTAATSAHHFETPTTSRRAPMAHRIEVALGASETIRWRALMAGHCTLRRLNAAPPSEILKAMSSLYTAAVLEHFQNPRNAGDLPGATAQVEVTNPVCGDILRLAARVENGCVAEVRFKTRGCVAAIACSSWLTEWMLAKTEAELRTLQPNGVAESLGGLAPASLHAADLACDALRALLNNRNS